jgi:deoxyadenosine/deoxycytidine kinase
MMTSLNDRVVYLSGPHGVGKSTLVTDLVGAAGDLDLQVSDQLAHMEALKEQTERQLWRIALHAIEHRVNMQKAATVLSTIVGDRCYVDDLVYIKAFVDLHWMSEQDRQAFLQLTNDTYRLTDTPKPSRVVLIVPPYEWNAERLRHRHDVEGEEPKWNEDNLYYLHAVNTAFHQLAADLKRQPYVFDNRPGIELQGENVLVLEETDRQKRVELVTGWLKQPVIAALPQLARGRSVEVTERHTYMAGS